MNKIKNTIVYLHLIRFFSQFGTALLFVPCFLGLCYTHSISLQSIVLFLVSSFFARSCGCILNDIADQKIDQKIITTQSRVLASGAISEKKALLFLFILIATSLPLLFLYSHYIILPLVIIGALVGIYPYTKRFFAIPQLFLGITYASGFILSIVNFTDYHFFYLKAEIFILYVGLILWVICYDTQYAKRDCIHDAQYNINSSVIFFEKHYKILAIPLVIVALIVFYLYCNIMLFLLIFTALCGLLYNIKTQLHFMQTNIVLILLLLISNTLFSLNAKNYIQYLLLELNLSWQIFLLFLNPMRGFKLNTLCIVPLGLFFWM